MYRTTLILIAGMLIFSSCSRNLNYFTERLNKTSILLTMTAISTIHTIQRTFVHFFFKTMFTNPAIVFRRTVTASITVEKVARSRKEEIENSRQESKPIHTSQLVTRTIPKTYASSRHCPPLVQNSTPFKLSPSSLLQILVDFD